MKLLTLNFLTCAVKTCKSSTASYPLQPKNCELVEDTIDASPKLILNILPRIDWAAMMLIASEVLPLLPILFPFTLLLFPQLPCHRG